MALLDRLRTQPRQKHPDAAVRLAFVEELLIDDRELLAEIARDDVDPRVRRAAVAKLMDPAALAGIASRDADEGVRAEALSMLRDIALEAFEGVTDVESLAAVDAVSDAKMLAAIAKQSEREPVAVRALAHIADPRTLGSIARHAHLESIRLTAFGALQDSSEVLAVALNSEFKDTALAAVDRCSGRGELDQIAARAKNKSAAKRARALLREMDERLAGEVTEKAVEAEGADRATAVASGPGPTAETFEVARREQEARALREQEEAAERERAAAEAARQRAAIEAEQAAERGRQEREARRRGRLAELAQEAEAAAAEPDLALAKRRFNLVRREWKDLADDMRIDSELADRYGAAQSRLGSRETEAREQDAKVRREALGRLHQLVSRVESLAGRADLSLKAGDRAARDIRAALADIPPLPSKADYEDVVRRLKAAQAALAPKVQELREVADWQRWANVGIQEQLCEKMEALKSVEDIEEIARRVRDLQQQWREAADVPRAQGEALWRRFKAAHDEVWTRCERYFAAQAEARAENLARKIALCERVEALADSTNWIQTAEEIKRLQAEWKTIGSVSRGQEKAVWERFRAACDRFFTRRQADLAERKKVWAENLARKEALCVQVEALAESSDWEATAAEIRRVQSTWKTIGPVKKSRSDAIWQRFRAGCDRFFTRYAERHDTAREERVAAREAICSELESLVDGDPPPDLVARVRALRARWQQETAARGVDRDRALALERRFQSGFANLVSRRQEAFAGTDLDPESNRKRMETLVRRMEDLARSVAGQPPGGADELSPTTRLAAMLKEALAANTIGGKVDEDTRLRAAAEEVRQAQASWSRIGPAPEGDRRALNDRFQRAVRQVSERAGGKGLRA